MAKAIPEINYFRLAVTIIMGSMEADRHFTRASAVSLYTWFMSKKTETTSCGWHELLKSEGLPLVTDFQQCHTFWTSLTVPLTKDQIFKHKRLWESFSFELPHTEGKDKCVIIFHWSMKIYGVFFQNQRYTTKAKCKNNMVISHLKTRQNKTLHQLSLKDLCRSLKTQIKILKTAKKNLANFRIKYDTTEEGPRGHQQHCLSSI